MNPRPRGQESCALPSEPARRPWTCTFDRYHEQYMEVSMSSLRCQHTMFIEIWSFADMMGGDFCWYAVRLICNPYYEWDWTSLYSTSVMYVGVKFKLGRIETIYHLCPCGGETQGKHISLHWLLSQNALPSHGKSMTRAWLFWFFLFYPIHSTWSFKIHRGLSFWIASNVFYKFDFHSAYLNSCLSPFRCFGDIFATSFFHVLFWSSTVLLHA